MARGRVIDKEIHRDEDLAKCPIEARYLYKGMIVHGDDKGRMKASPVFLKVTIFPFDEALRVDTVRLWRDKIAAVGLIKLYVAGGKEYLSHPNWEKWQPIRKDRKKPSDCPEPWPGNVLATTCQPSDNQPPPIPYLTVPNHTEPEGGRSNAPAVPDPGEERRKGGEVNAERRTLWQPYFAHFYESILIRKRLDRERFRMPKADRGRLTGLYDGYGPETIMACWDLWWESGRPWSAYADSRGHALNVFADNKTISQLLDAHDRKAREAKYRDQLGTDAASLAKVLKEESGGVLDIGAMMRRKPA